MRYDMTFHDLGNGEFAISLKTTSGMRVFTNKEIHELRQISKAFRGQVVRDLLHPYGIAYLPDTLVNALVALIG